MFVFGCYSKYRPDFINCDRSHEFLPYAQKSRFRMFPVFRGSRIQMFSFVFLLVHLFQSNNPEEVLEPGPLSQRRRDEQDKLDELEMSQICWDTDPFAELSSEDSEPEPALNVQDKDPKPGPSRIRHQDELDAQDNLEMTQAYWGAEPFAAVSSDDSEQETDPSSGVNKEVGTKPEPSGVQHHEISSDESIVNPTPEKPKHSSNNSTKGRPSRVFRHQDQLDEQDNLEMSKICWNDEKSSDNSEVETADKDSANIRDDKSSETESDQLWDGEKSFWKNLNLDEFEEK